MTTRRSGWDPQISFKKFQLLAAPTTSFPAKKFQIQIHNFRCDYIIHIIEHIIFTGHKQHNAYIQIHNVHKRHNPYIQSPQTTNQNI